MLIVQLVFKCQQKGMFYLFVNWIVLHKVFLSRVQFLFRLVHLKHGTVFLSFFFFFFWASEVSVYVLLVNKGTLKCV